MKQRLVLICVVAVMISAAVVMIGYCTFWFVYQEQPPQPFDYKFFYSQNNRLFIYDLDTDVTQAINLEITNPGLGYWSNDGKVAFGDWQNNIYVLNTRDNMVKKIAENSYDFPISWTADNSTILFEQEHDSGRSLLDVNYSPTGDIQKAYALNVNTGVKQTISRNAYRSLVATSSATIKKQPVSYDGRYFIDEKGDFEIVSYLQDKKTNLQYNLPKDIQTPTISTNNTYITWAKYLVNEEKSKLFIFKLKDILAGNFLNPIRTIEGVESADDWAWIDDRKLIYIVNKLKKENNTTIGGSVSYFTIDVPSGKIEELIGPNEAPGYYVVFVSPDRKRFVRMVNEGSSGEVGPSVDRIAIHELSTGKEIRRFQYDTGTWSPPIITPKKSFKEFVKTFWLDLFNNH